MIAIYARQSVEKIGSVSVEAQISLCKSLCETAEPIKVFTDVGYSGKNTKRPAFQEMIKEMKNREISQIMVYKLDRISRSIADFSNLMCLMESYNVRFISCTEWFDTQSPMGRAMLSIAATFAQLERETISQRVSDTYQLKCRKGSFMGGRVPLGFCLNTDNHYLEENPEEARIVHFIFQKYLEKNGSYYEVARCCNEKGFLTRNGKRFQAPRIGEIITNPCYVNGNKEILSYAQEQKIMVYNDAKKDGLAFFAHKEKGNCNKIWVQAQHEGFIDASEWIQAQRKRQSDLGKHFV